MTGLERDIAHILEHTQGLWEELRGASIFVSGGTGFFGRWMVESFCAANREFQLGARLTVLSRNPPRDGISYCSGDVRNFEFPKGDFSHVIHLATPSSGPTSLMEIHEICVDGTRRVLELAKTRGAQKFLLASSGAIYGRQARDLEKTPEDFLGGPDPLDPRSAYAEGNYVHEQQAMSIAMRVFHENPVIRGVGPDGQPWQVTLTLERRSYDELSRLWQATTSALRLSAVYRASVVLLETEKAPPSAPVVSVVNVDIKPDTVPEKPDALA